MCATLAIIESGVSLSTSSYSSTIHGLPGTMIGTGRNPRNAALPTCRALSYGLAVE
jgi:hypothetical protein